jgi:hypothetical protein
VCGVSGRQGESWEASTSLLEPRQGSYPTCVNELLSLCTS